MRLNQELIRKNQVLSNQSELIKIIYELKKILPLSCEKYIKKWDDIDKSEFIFEDKDYEKYPWE